MDATMAVHDSRSRAQSHLKQARVRIRAAGEASERARRASTDAARLDADNAVLRGQLPIVATTVQQAISAARTIRGRRATSAWYALRGRLVAERARRAAALQEAIAERGTLAGRIAEQDAEARALREEAARLSSAAAALPRLLDEAAACLRRVGGSEAEALEAAEGGLEPVLRREANLDHALRWTRWAQKHVDGALDRLGPARTFTRYDYYLPYPLGDTSFLHDSGSGAEDERVAAARAALAGLRDVLAVLVQALTDLGVGTDGVDVPEIPVDLSVWFDHLDGPTSPASRSVTDALAAGEQVAVQLVALRERIAADHAATRRVLQTRRAQWCAILRGA